ncbi:hypothetical protein KZ843_06890 [Pseudomonas aeruginosa]|nr:hypothetical protein [Pseudomonas aeruginosa]MBW6122619.1 hypothetical protein [Pseudomonas aeruginosa]
MEIQQVGKLHLWTSGDGSVGISGESAEVSAPGWLLSSEHFDAEDFKSTLEQFREKVRTAFELIWPDEKVHARYDFEMCDGEPTHA